MAERKNASKKQVKSFVVMLLFICSLILGLGMTCNPLGPTVSVNVAEPTFSPPGGTYSGAQDVTITSETSGAIVYFTTNGETPTTSSDQYTDSIPVTGATTIKAFALKDGMTDSEVVSAAYTIFDDWLIGTWAGFVEFPGDGEFYEEVIFAEDGTISVLAYDLPGGPVLDDRSIRGTYVVDGYTLSYHYTEMWYEGAWHLIEAPIVGAFVFNEADVGSDPMNLPIDFDGDGNVDAYWVLTEQ
jgi:hypothetical protein